MSIPKCYRADFQFHDSDRADCMWTRLPASPASSERLRKPVSTTPNCGVARFLLPSGKPSPKECFFQLQPSAAGHICGFCYTCS
jgi:hypothetical protein